MVVCSVSHILSVMETGQVYESEVKTWHAT